MYLHRTLESFARSAAEQFPVLLVTGARQVGKTTMLKHMSEPERTYVSLDDTLLLELAKRDPILFLQRFRPPLLIDEIQYAPELLPYIKMEVDNTNQPNYFWMTGSQQFHLMKGVSESLAGRVAIVQLLGLSRQERTGHGTESKPFIPTEIARDESITLRKLYSMIWRGSYPAIAINPEMDRDLFYSSYVQTYLQRDVRDLARVGDEMAFLRFLRIAAARTGQLLNISEFARDADIAVNTAKSWLSIMQASGIIYLLEPYHNNLSKRMIKTPKLYFMDTGLCSYLTGWSSPETLEAGAMSGGILETWVVTELLKSYLHSGKQPPFYYYRDRDKKEIDLLIIRDGTVYPLEIKKTASPSVSDVRSFNLLEKLGMPVGIGGVICLCRESLPITESTKSIPVGAV
ncbi:MAG: ATP-binding protein [Armatimonadota bacterium]